MKAKLLTIGAIALVTSACGGNQKPTYTVETIPEQACVFVIAREGNGWTASALDPGEKNISGVYCKEGEK